MLKCRMYKARFPDPDELRMHSMIQHKGYRL